MSQSTDLLEKLKNQMAKAEAERDLLVGDLDSQYKRAVDSRLAAEYLAGIKAYKERIVKANDDSLAQLRANLEMAQKTVEKEKAAELEAQNKRAGEVEVELKATLRAAWISAGGAPDDFESAWPDLKRQELLKRTMAAVGDAAPGHGGARDYF